MSDIGIDVSGVGLSPPEFRRVQAALPANFAAISSPEEFWEQALPLWLDRRLIGRPQAGAKIELATFSHPGLFWAEQDFRVGGLTMAIQTLYSFAYLLDLWPASARLCNITAARVRSRLLEMRLVIDHAPTWKCSKFDVTANIAPNGFVVWGDRLVEEEFENAYESEAQQSAITSMSHVAAGKIVLCDPGIKKSAAIADYYFWWSRRLYDYWHRCGHADLKLAADLTAKWAMSHVASIAAGVLHELMHEDRFMGSGHCRANFQHSNDDPATGTGKRKDCCIVTTQLVWYSLICAELGLPPSSTSIYGSAADPFASTGSYTRRAVTCGEGGFVEMRHCSMLSQRHGAEIEWGISADCRTSVAERLGLNAGILTVNGPCLVVGPQVEIRP